MRYSVIFCYIIHSALCTWIYQNKANFFKFRKTRYHKIGEGSTMAAYVGWTGGNLRTRTSSSHSKFPEGVRGIDVRFKILFSIQSAMRTIK